MVRHAKGTAEGVWRERLDRFAGAGLSVKDFCAAEAVSEASFYQWRQKLAGEGRPCQNGERRRPAVSVFQTVRVTPIDAVWSIEFPGGARIEAPADQLKLARALVKELVRASRADGEFLTHGHVRRPYLGITATVTPIPRSLVRELDLLSDRAVEVVAIEPGGPASAGGILPGDLIVAVNDRVVTSVDDVHRLISDFQNHPLLTLTILRGKRKLHADVRPAIPH